LVSLKGNISVNWAHRDSTRAKIRVLVKRILRKYGYPPNLQDAAVQTVLQQAEVLSAGCEALGDLIFQCNNRAIHTGAPQAYWKRI